MEQRDEQGSILKRSKNKGEKGKATFFLGR